MTCYAPVSGTLIDLSKTVDPVFAEKMLGNGLSINPKDSETAVRSPIVGMITQVNASAHAVVIKNDDGTIMLVHVGVDTVNLAGKGFTCHVKKGERVEHGTVLMNVDFKYVRENALADTVFMIVTNNPDVKIMPLNSSATVESGKAIAEFV